MMRRRLVFGVCLIGLLILFGCASKGQKPIDRADMDFSIKPGVDFFQFVNGGWLARTEIPADKVSYASFDIVREKRDQDVRKLLEKVSKIKNAESGTTTQLISDFYSSGMDIQNIESLGISVLQPELDRIAAIATVQDVQDVIAYFHTIGLDPLFGGGVEQDMANTEIRKFYLMQAGLGLPDRDYYTKEDDRSKEIRAKYIEHIARIFGLMGEDSTESENHAAMVMALESRLANKSKTRLEMRNIQGLYNRMTLEQLKKTAPGFDWKRYFQNISETDFGDVIVGMPVFFHEVGFMMQEIPVEEWKTYLRWNLINNMAAYLNQDFVQANFDFYSAFLSGSEKMQERWQQVVGVTNGLLGEPVGQLYVESYFPPEAKNRMLQLVDNLKIALKERITNLAWMEPSTKEEALAKLNTMKVKIGYPDKWEDYSKMKIDRDSYARNIIQANNFLYNKNLNEFGKPVDPDKWGMTPQTVNAGYNPLKNDITFPAGILQPPFFYMDADDAVNYGAIGVVIGHEATHGFDDQGRGFDKNGNMRDWWTKRDDEEFRRRVEPLIEQYDAFVAIGDVHIDGRLTLGENIADFGGLTVAYHAYQMAMKGKPEPELIEGFTDDQRFFLAFAKIWQGKIRDEALMRKCREDVHPWGKFRVNGALFNVPEFYQAFEIQPDDPLYRSESLRPVIW